MIEAEAVRWVGMLTALGVLIPISLWFALTALGPRARNVVAATSGVMLAVVAAGAVGAMSVAGYTLAIVTSDVNDGREGRELFAIALAILGLAAGLAVSLTLRSRDDVDDVADAPVTVEDEPPVEEDPPRAADDDAPANGDAYWAAHGGETVPFAAPVAPVGAATLTLLLIAVALALPTAGFRVGPGVLGLDGDVGGAEAASMVLDGVRTGLALLLAALALRGREVVAVGASFGLVALGQGLATAYPDTFGNEFWYMFATGLTAGLILPPALRLLTPSLVADRAAFAAGVAIVVALLVAQTWASSTAIYGDNEIGELGDNIVVPAVPSVPRVPVPVPTFSFEPPVFPTDLPTFPTDFPTFQFPSGFPS